MGELILPGLDRDVVEDRGTIQCAAQFHVGGVLTRCQSRTRQDIRMADSMPAPADAGWFEVQIEVPWRTTFFACSKRCAQAVAALWVPDSLRAMSDRPVLPPG